MIKFLAVAILAASLCQILFAQGDGDPSSQRMSFTAKDEDVRVTLTRLFQMAEVPVRIQPRISGKVTVSMVDQSFESILQSTLKQVNATYRVQGGRFEIVLRSLHMHCPNIEPDEEYFERTKQQVRQGGSLFELKGEILRKIDLRTGKSVAHQTFSRSAVGLTTLPAQSLNLEKAADRKVIVDHLAEAGLYVFFVPEVKGKFSFDPTKSRIANLESLCSLLACRLDEDGDIEPMVASPVELIPIEITSSYPFDLPASTMTIAGNVIQITLGGWNYRVRTSDLGIESAKGRPIPRTS